MHHVHRAENARLNVTVPPLRRAWRASIFYQLWENCFSLTYEPIEGEREIDIQRIGCGTSVTVEWVNVINGDASSLVLPRLVADNAAAQAYIALV
jgi:hypothetical protein